MNITYYGKYDLLRDLLTDCGCPLSADLIERIDTHIGFVQSHGRSFGVVSAGDVERGVFDHVVDSLSLLPYLKDWVIDGLSIVDVGSGGGFPGLICGSAFPDTDVSLIDRSKKKCSFLRLCVGGMKLSNVSVFDISFSEYSWDAGPVIVLIRGLEQAEVFVPELVSCLAPGSVCFWLTGRSVNLDFDSRFHVEQIVDKWSESGLRRGVCFKISADEISDAS